jgi:peptide/nickel transport system permease protein
VAGAGSLAHLILPATALALRSAALLARLTRASLLEVLGQDYIRTARAKGASELRILCRHALPIASLPLVAAFAVQFGHLLLGAVVLEMVFARPGLGKLVVDAIAQRDYPVLQAFVLVAGTVFVVLNLVADAVCAVLDPRIRLGEGVRAA